MIFTSQKPDDDFVLDILPMDLCIDENGIARPLIKRNTSIPCRKSVTVETVRDNQTMVVLNLVQGFHEFTENNKKLAKYRIVNLQKGKAGEIKVRIDIDVDDNLIVRLNSFYEDTGEKAEAELYNETEGKWKKYEGN